MKCRCGFDAENESHLRSHVAFYRGVPGQDGKHGMVTL